MQSRPAASTTLDRSDPGSTARRAPDEPKFRGPIAARRWRARDVATHLLIGSGATALGLVLVYATGGRLWLPRPAAVALLVLGPVAWTLWFAGPRREAGEPQKVHHLGARAWIVLGLLFWGWELAAYLLGDAPIHPTFSRLVSPIVRNPPLKILAIVGWLVWGRLLGRAVRGESIKVQP